MIPGASGSDSVGVAAPGKAAAIERVYFGHGNISATRTGIIRQAAPKQYILGGQRREG